MIGQTIAHYRIVGKLGSGGMGDVYVAEDTRLDRRVALKTLPRELADHPERRVRFAREAKAVAALNHPNIVTLYSVEEADGVHFITMELVEGKTLTDMLPRSGFALDRFFAIAIPLTDALVAAHQQGITHRDLKPGNVMVGEDGRVKVLDFGLARIDSWSGSDETHTLTATQDGLIIGTPSYMSPEQADGQKVDVRSDIFSLGVVFYELLTGHRPFGGNTPTATLSAILRDTPRPVTQLQPAIPRELGRIIHRCLAKNPVDRYQSALDLRHSLVETKEDLDSGEVLATYAAPVRTRTKRVPLMMLVGASVAVAAGAWMFIARDEPDGMRAPGLQNPVQLTSSLDVESYPTWSPDGLRLAYQASAGGYHLLANHDIWVAQAGSGEPINLTNHLANDRMPSWSPDGREIAFFSDRDGVWGLYAMAAIGGNPRHLLSLPGFAPNSWSAPQWSADGRRLFVSVRQSNENVVIVLSLDSLESTRMSLPRHEEDVVWDLRLSPDGGRFTYVAAGGGNPEVGQLWTMRVTGGEPVPITDGRTSVWSPTWSSNGRAVFYVSNRGGRRDLWQQALADDGSAVGEPVAITQGLGIRSAAFSPDGTRLAYAQGGQASNVWRVPILSDRPATWADAVRVTAEHAYIEFVDVSPDGTRLAVSSDRRGNQDLWLLPAGGGDMTPLTTDPTPDWHPRWSPDGREIAFYALRSGNRDIWVMPSGGGPARQLTSHPARDWFPSWSPDGRQIGFRRPGTGGTGVWAVSASGGEPRFITTGNPFEWAPDGRWLAVGGQRELYRISTEGGSPVLLTSTVEQPGLIRFSRDGRSLFYSADSGPPANLGIWKFSPSDRKTTRLTTFEARPGRFGYSFAVSAEALYVIWHEDVGDIWVMDVVTDGSV